VLIDYKKGLKKGPFSDNEAEKLDEALSGLSADQLQWLCGFITGATQSSLALPGATKPQDQIADTVAEKLTILYGSHTGNCEALAKKLADQAKAIGIEAELSDMASFKPRDLQKITNLAVLVSTHGLGEPPVQAQDLYQFLHGKKAPNLSHVKFSVLALGDSSYVDFCQTGKDFDTVLEKLGADRILPRVDCDVDFEEDVERWTDKLFSVIGQKPNGHAPAAVKEHAPVTIQQQEYSRKNPFEATILEKIKLNGRGSSKETIHLELDLQGSGLRYEPGDALGVYGTNSPVLIEGVLQALHLSGEERVKTHNGEKTLQDALSYDYELSPLSNVSLTKYAEITGSKYLQEILSEKAMVLNYLLGRDILDLLNDVPYQLNANELLSVLRKNTPRMYSIASAQEAVDDEVHLLVSVVRYHALGRDKEGLCSATLADRFKEDDKVKVFVDKNTRFKPPSNPETPIIMVGPGTGIAPFRAFMQQREVAEKKGKSWLFFGDRNFTTDFLYQAEWQQYLKEGILTKADVAFSRDQDKKEYVQHKMLEKGKELYDWLENGAHLYVCGDAKQMAKDVDQTLKEIIQQQEGASLEKAEAYIRNLQLSNRYQTDVY
jgi:sulfite reductase (NADPH) flavoprotein alpha-component